MSKAKVITFGEVMLRFSTQAFARFTQAGAFDVTYAGAEANVAVSVARFGIPSAHVTRFPNNDLGEAATLLRGAPAPAPEALLRPAAGSLEESTTLLKASEGEIDHQSRQPDIPEVDMLGLKDA